MHTLILDSEHHLHHIKGRITRAVVCVQKLFNDIKSEQINILKVPIQYRERLFEHKPQLLLFCFMFGANGVHYPKSLFNKNNEGSIA